MIPMRHFPEIQSKHCWPSRPDGEFELRFEHEVDGVPFPGEKAHPDVIRGFQTARGCAAPIAAATGRGVAIWETYMAKRLLDGTPIPAIRRDFPEALTVRAGGYTDERDLWCLQWDVEMERLSQRTVETATISSIVQLNAGMAESAGYPNIAAALVGISNLLAEEVDKRDAEYDAAHARRMAEIEERRRNRTKPTRRRSAAATVPAAVATA